MNARYADLVFYRGLAELRAEASRAYLGIFWWVLEPMLYVGVFYLVFGLGLRRGGDGFVAYLLCGLVPWKWFDSTVRTAMNTISQSVGLMRQVYLPKYLLPLVVVVSNTAKFFLILVIFLVFLTLYGISPWQPSLAYLPLLVLIQLLMTLAVAGFAAAVVPFVPDFRYLINFSMTLLFFMSGIFFSLSEMPPEVQEILVYNPVLVLIEAYRAVLLHGAAPDLSGLAWVSLFSLCLLFFVGYIFHRYDRSYPRVVG